MTEFETQLREVAKTDLGSAVKMMVNEFGNFGDGQTYFLGNNNDGITVFIHTNKEVQEQTLLEAMEESIVIIDEATEELEKVI